MNTTFPWNSSPAFQVYAPKLHCFVVIIQICYVTSMFLNTLLQTYLLLLFVGIIVYSQNQCLFPALLKLCLILIMIGQMDVILQ